MKNLLILRHAKSSWADSSISDHQRPLNKRGQRDAPRIGELIRQQQLIPDYILSSTAVRALTTAQLVAESCGFAGSVRSLDDLYLAAPQSYLSHVGQVDDDAERVLVVGHNPGIEQLVGGCSGEYQSMPTAALAWITFEVESWQDVGSEHGTLEQVWRPKELDD